MSNPKISIHRLSDLTPDQRSGLLQRTENDISAFIDRVVPIIEDVRVRGDAALADLALSLDKANLSPKDVRATPQEFAAARSLVDPEVIETLRFAAGNIRHFHEKQLPDSLSLHETRPGVIVGDRWTPIDSVACYVTTRQGFISKLGIDDVNPRKGRWRSRRHRDHPARP